MLRPAARLRRGTVAVAAVFGLVSLSPAGALGGAPALLVTAVVAAAVCALLWVRVSRVRVVVSERCVESFGVFRSRVHARAEAARVVRARLVPARGLPFPAVFVLNAGGGVVVRLNGGTYAREDLDRLADHLGLPVSGPAAPVTARQLAVTHPGIVPFFEARPLLTGFVAAAVVVPVILVVALIAALSSFL
ncbi:hypothetical protein D7319_28290 [Streptomyces radicis]|uniref:PH domain-containing protein n=1 Tax=Streptomyces radicis TaxID=1750517 RepID=A0A3A9VU52_9ACTN|nr:hypothetical protein D7319_28290 [Streptomyces radicis]RKN15513.1 hypothetical protein D7318_27695 [Streptomyces radicis]